MNKWAALAAAGTVTAVGGRRRRADDLAGEVAVVTGASRGLGLLLARELAGRGCRLVICARDAEELERAATDLRTTAAPNAMTATMGLAAVTGAAHVEVVTVAADLTDESTPQRLVDTALERFGRLDIVISNAGVIRVGPVQSTEPADYETALRTMTLAPVRLALAALPVMRRQEHGRIVTIASIGGKVSPPHLLPYATAKFAAVGFSEGLRAELGAGPVTVTTVVPGLMRTGSHVQALFSGNKAAEFTWFTLAASLPLLSMDAERAARQIIAAVAERRPEVILTPLGQVAARAAGVAPGLTARVLHLTSQVVLPTPDGGPDGSTAGRHLRPVLSQGAFGWLTTLGREASRRFNQGSGEGSGP